LDQNPVAQFVNALVGALASGLGEALAQVAIVIFSVLVASPAIGSVLLVATAHRWPALERSPALSGVAGAVLTALSGLAMGLAVGAVADSMVELKAVNLVLPYLALIAVVGAIWFQFSERATFSRARGVGIACAVAVPIVLVLVNQ
jgi:hypothetical protein